MYESSSPLAVLLRPSEKSDEDDIFDSMTDDAVSTRSRDADIDPETTNKISANIALNFLVSHERNRRGFE